MAGSNTLTSEDILKLMQGMHVNGIGAMEYAGLKLVAARNEPVLSAASGISVPRGPLPPEPTEQDAMAAIKKATERAREQAATRKVDMDTHKERVRSRLIGGPLNKAIEGLVQDSKADKTRSVLPSVMK